MVVGIGRPARSHDVVDALLECHERIRRFIAMAQSIAHSHAEPAEVIEACERCERYFVDALPLHVQDEELSIERRMKGLDPEVDEALAAMHRQHGEQEALVQELIDWLRAVRTSPRPTPELADAAQRLSDVMEEHLGIEEQVIFPAMRKLLSPAAQNELLAEIRGRRR